MLSHSPPFPLIIYYPGKRSTTMSEEDKHGAKVALQQRERVHRVHIAAPASNLRDLVQVMNDEYPNLQRLLIRAQADPRADRRNRNRNRNDAVTVTLHEGLRAPLLHRVTLSNVGLPTSSRLLSGAGEDLVSLGLLNFPAEPPDLHPAHLTAQLAALSHLELLTVHFSTAVPNRQVMRQLQGAPTTRIALPRLRMLAYRGGSAYLEGILARLDAPHLHTLSVEFFNQFTFSVPSLLHFARAMNALTFRSAALYFDEDFVSLIVDPLDKRAGDGGGGGGGTHPLHVQVKGKLLDWQVTSISQICSTLAPLLAQTENLMLGFHKDGPDPAAAGAVEAEAPGAAAGWQVAVDRAQWRALFRIFAGVKTLQLSGGRIGDLFRALQPRVGEGNGGGEGEGADEEGTNDDGVDGGVFTPEILPALQKLVPRGWGDPDDAFASFIAARTAAGLPVRLVRSRS